MAKGERVTGEDCVPVILFPMGIPNMKEAIDRAIESAGPEFDALVDGVVYHKNYSFLFGQICYTIEGTPINTKTSISRLNTERESQDFLGNRHPSFLRFSKKDR